MTTRRSFMAGILAAAAAPAVVRSESLIGWDLGAGDWSVEAWIRQPDLEAFRLVCITHSHGLQQAYIDGEQVSNDHPLISASIGRVVESGAIDLSWGVRMDEIRLISGRA